MTPEQKALDVFSEEFQALLLDTLTKFIAEYDDMAHMTVLQRARELLDEINNQ